MNILIELLKIWLAWSMLEAAYGGESASVCDDGGGSAGCAYE